MLCYFASQPIPLSPTNGAEQLAFNVIFSGVDDLPKTVPRSRHQSTSGYNTPDASTGNAGSVTDLNNWDNRSMISGVRSTISPFSPIESDVDVE